MLLELLARLEEGHVAMDAEARSTSLARMGAEIFADYQRSLAFRGAVDFDDLIRLALEALHAAPDYLARLRQRWPFVLEDEAQDSSKLQEEILQTLVGENGNWVRVGDPNQAIYETFTTASPLYLRAFLKKAGVSAVTLDESGRSQPAIIDLANHLVDWARASHPNERVRDAFVNQHIRPTAPGDPQPNPPADPTAVKLEHKELSPDQELQAIAQSLKEWLPDHQTWTVAVLVPRNERGFQVSSLLKAREIPHVELLRSTDITRQTAGVLGNLLHFLADPASSRKLSVAFRVWRREDRDNSAGKQPLTAWPNTHSGLSGRGSLSMAPCRPRLA